MKEYVGFIIMWVIVILMIGIKSSFVIRKKFLKSEFMMKYHLTELPKKIKIKKKLKKSIKNYFELNFPYWLYANRDGTMDKRRRGNKIIWQHSFLYIEEYTVRIRKPLELVLLVNELREKNSELIIEKSLEERGKFEEIYENKTLNSKCNEIQSIIDRFKNNPTEFENFTGELFQKMGYEATVTPKTNDGGVDVILCKDGIKTIVECKCYAQGHNIGRPLLQKIVGANYTQKADKVAFVTTSDFSAGALEYAKETGVQTINGKQLTELVSKYFNVDNEDVSVDRSEWELNKKDIYEYLPCDMYEYI